MSMVPLETEANWPTNLGTVKQREPGWISLMMILAAIVGIITLCIAV